MALFLLCLLSSLQLSSGYASQFVFIKLRSFLCFQTEFFLISKRVAEQNVESSINCESLSLLWFMLPEKKTF